MKKFLYLQVVVAIVAGGLLGHFDPDFAIKLKPLGDGFIAIVKMVIPPVVFLTIVTGIANMGGLGKLAGVAAKTFGYFLVFSTLALVVGMLAANILQPGAGMNVDPSTLSSDVIMDYASKADDMSVVDFLIGIIPTSMIGAFAEGNLLQVLAIAILFGIGCSLVGEKAQPALLVFTALSQVVFRIVDILMRLAPIGAFGAMAFTIGKFGTSSIVNLAALILVFYATSLVFIVVVLGSVCAFCRVSLFRLLRYIKSEILLVVGTSSSESALPSLMEKLERAGCSRSVAGLVVPTGYSFNLDGTNIYMSLAALFIAQATNTPLSLEQQLALLGVAMLSSKGAAGVTGSGFITLAATLSVVPTVPLAGIAIVLGVDRFMSECRAVTNFIGNAVATIAICRWENAVDMVQLQAALAGQAPKKEKRILHVAGPSHVEGESRAS